jgi:hypothetical protein
MRGRRWLSIGTIALGVCFLGGCLRDVRPPEAPMPRSNVSARAATDAAEQAKQPDPPESNYLVSQNPSVQLDVQAPAAVEKTAEKSVEPVEMRIQSEESSSPPPPADSPEPRKEVLPAPLKRPDAPSVQLLRVLHEQHSEEEINEHLKPFDAPTRELMLVLLDSVTQVEQVGGITRIAPRDLAVWTDRLNTLTASLRGRAQLSLGRTCFCSHINNFGDFTPLPLEHAFFQPGELAHVYVEVRNFSCRRQQDRYLTALKGRLEIYDEDNHAAPSITWVSRLREDGSATPRQDYYINCGFQVPPNCPAGLHTMRIAIEDWTDAPEGAKEVPESRIAQRTLDFRVGGPMARPARPRVAEGAPAP